MTLRSKDGTQWCVSLARRLLPPNSHILFLPARECMEVLQIHSPNDQSISHWYGHLPRRDISNFHLEHCEPFVLRLISFVIPLTSQISRFIGKVGLERQAKGRDTAQESTGCRTAHRGVDYGGLTIIHQYIISHPIRPPTSQNKYIITQVTKPTSPFKPK